MDDGEEDTAERDGHIGSLSSASTPPALPSRPSTLRSKSSASYVTLASTSIPDASGLTYSPFDSPREDRLNSGCSNFKQKSQRSCNDCFELHFYLSGFLS